MEPTNQFLDIEGLDLDPINPRLPESVQNLSQSELLRYLYKYDVLEELIDSFVSNGYFPAEPILVLPADQDGRRVVVEGNRRLAALMILLQLPPALEAGISKTLDPPPTQASLDRLHQVPAVAVGTRRELTDYLGFRHISGLKQWAPEAKARWLYLEVEDARQAGSHDPFFEVGRRVGSNARGVRSAYNAYNVLRYGRDILHREAAVDFVMSERFGVWTRLLGTANVPTYLGLNKKAASYEDVRQQVEDINPDRFEEVISDLIPQNGKGKAVLEDSREATDYSTIIADDRARETLRRYGSLRLARDVAEQGDIGNRLHDLRVTMEALTLDVARYTITKPDAEAATEVFNAARSLRGAVTAAMSGEDE